MLLTDRTALIVGVANERSYAWHIAKSLKEHGARLAFTHLPGDKNEHRTRRAVEALGIASPWLVPMDVSKDSDIDAAMTRYAESFQSLHVLVHSIAFADRDYLAPGKFIDTPRHVYLAALDVSAYSLLAITRRAKDMLVRSAGGGAGGGGGGASVMAMSYYGGEKVVPGYNVMGVAKAALESTARYLAWELGPHNVRVNVISGGYLRTLASSAVGGADAVTDHVAKNAPLRRNVEGADVGKTAVYLASDLSSGVSGETVFVDCGINTLGL
ncbi:MAG: enoyl-[acyl-carrier-protein] reductase FabI [Planctomyces sp.]|nr:enoyl-[acyl-carrier-protein] reductase FabI [Planctomyces sp.]MBA4039710.1 enoyl-[acyl-carrier-protein] reductase FabI [Planctomyces sp.]MBA4119719.1 enoyl-[acyl-carrier-protein] reductase FabI [Isosphaera sp.]